MEELNIGTIVYAGLSVLCGGMVVGFTRWLWKRFNSIEEGSEKGQHAISIEEARLLVGELTISLINAETARVIAKEEAKELRADIKSMAQTMLSAVEKQERRLDRLLLQLLNSKDEK